MVDINKEVKILTEIATDSISELDPSLQGGYHLSIETDLPMRVLLKGQE